MDITPNTLHNLNRSLPTVFLIHGWHTSVSIDIYLLNITTAYRDLNDRNVIFVDWSNTAQNSYIDVVFNGISRVGNKVGEMIMLLHDTLEIDVKTIHIVAVTLGAHIAGYAGRYVQEHHPENAAIGRITGLEAAGALFESYFGVQNVFSLRRSDADVVDVTHTNSIFWGSNQNVGSVDFYVNGGETQRFCGESTAFDLISPSLVNTCSHAFAIILYRLTIDTHAYKASSNPENCENLIVYGDNLDLNATGIYYINTEDDWPYKTLC